MEGCGNVAGTERRKLIRKKLVSVARVDKMDSIFQVVHRMRRYSEKLLFTMPQTDFERKNEAVTSACCIKSSIQMIYE